MFLEQVIRSYFDGGKIEINPKFTPQRVKRIVFKSMDNTNRFNGLIEQPCSLIEHCCFVSKYAQDLYRIDTEKFDEQEYLRVGLLGLIHDVGQVAVGDMVYPLKMRNCCKQQVNDLESAFVKWFMWYVYQFEVQGDDRLLKYVRQADYQSGVFELIGISLNDDFETKEFFGRMIDLNKKLLGTDGNIKSYEDRLKWLLRGIKDEKAV